MCTCVIYNVRTCTFNSFLSLSFSPSLPPSLPLKETDGQAQSMKEKRLSTGVGEEDGEERGAVAMDRGKKEELEDTLKSKEDVASSFVPLSSEDESGSTPVSTSRRRFKSGVSDTCSLDDIKVYVYMYIYSEILKATINCGY